MFDDFQTLSDHSQRPSVVVVEMGSRPSYLETRCFSHRLGGEVVIVRDEPKTLTFGLILPQANTTNCANLIRFSKDEKKKAEPFWRGLRKYRKAKNSAR
jgi:hypothetical protein